MYHILLLSYIKLAYVWLLKYSPTNGNQVSQVFPVEGTSSFPPSGSLDLEEEYCSQNGDPQKCDEKQGKRNARAFAHLAIPTTTTVGGMFTSRVATMIRLLIARWV